MQQDSKRILTAPQPAATYLAADAFYVSVVWDGFGFRARHRARHSALTTLNPRHRLNMLYLDGHVQPLEWAQVAITAGYCGSGMEWRHERRPGLVTGHSFTAFHAMKSIQRSIFSQALSRRGSR